MEDDLFQGGGGVCMNIVRTVEKELKQMQWIGIATEVINFELSFIYKISFPIKCATGSDGEEWVSKA